MTKKQKKNKCVFCGKPTEYYKPGIGYICAKCLGEYEGARLRELGRRDVEPTPITPWYPSWQFPSTTWPGIPGETWWQAGTAPEWLVGTTWDFKIYHYG